MDISKDFKSFQDQVQDCLKKTTKTAGYIAVEDLNFHRSSNAAVAKALDSQNDRLLRLTNKLTKYVTSGSDVRPPQLRDQEDVEDNWRGVVDVIDDLLERTDACLDEFTGVIKRLSPSRQTSTSEASPSRPTKFPSMYGGPSLNMAKPQLLFEKATDNMLDTPFKPLLTSKPHAIVPQEESIGDGEKE
jgi:exosome complex exonuclease RRP6